MIQSFLEKLRAAFPPAYACSEKGFEKVQASLWRWLKVYRPDGSKRIADASLVVGDGGMKAEDFLSMNPVDLFTSIKPHSS